MACVFGPAPPPGARRPPFAGVPQDMFLDGLPTDHAFKVYNDVIRDEKRGRYALRTLELNDMLILKKEELLRTRDLIAGYSSVAAAYQDLGWSKHPVSGLPVPPEVFPRITDQEVGSLVQQRSLNIGLSGQEVRLPVRPRSASTCSRQSSAAESTTGHCRRREAESRQDFCSCVGNALSRKSAHGKNAGVCSKSRERIRRHHTTREVSKAASPKIPSMHLATGTYCRSLPADADANTPESLILSKPTSGVPAKVQRRSRPSSAPVSRVSNSSSGCSQRNSQSAGRTRSAIAASTLSWPFQPKLCEGRGAEQAIADRAMAQLLKERTTQTLVFC